MVELGRNRARDVILGVYRSQLRKFRNLSIYDDYGNFLFGKKTEFGTKVTEDLIKITEKRLLELINKKLSARGITRLEDIQNNKTE